MLPDTKHGAVFQEQFTERWTALGKTAWIHRFSDSADLYGRNKKLVRTDAQPADFLVGHAGVMSYVECKATKDKKGFRIGMLEHSQIIAATKSVAAKTNYFLAIKSEMTQVIHFVPATIILSEKGTISWDDLGLYIWREGRPPPWLPMTL